MVATAPKFANLAKALLSFFDGCDLAGYNIVGFDVPMISEEFARCGIEWPAEDVRYIDAFKIFLEKEKRDLAGAARFYLNKDHTGAHDARVDVIMTVQVAAKQLMQYTDLAAMTPSQLSKFCTGERSIDLAGKIVLNEAGIPVYGFGKDKGKPVQENPGFGKWMLGQSFPTNTKNIIKKLIGNG